MPAVVDPIDRSTHVKPLRITVLCGGPSAEREVSLDSGRAVAEALRRCGHEVLVADIGPDRLSALDHPADVIFPALHGQFGEDGQLQRILAERGIAFVGADVRAAALAMDKVASKRLAVRAGARTPDFQVISARGAARTPLRIRPPLVVKPRREGSSVGTFIVRPASDPLTAMHEARSRIEEVAQQFGSALVEQFIEGDEITVGLLDGQPLPPLRIRPKREFYDYDAKYRVDDTEYEFVAPDDGCETVQSLSRAVYGAVGCRHLARADWIRDRAGDWWFLEINTMPGFTSHSLLPKAAARAGIAFDQLVDRLVRMAIT